MLGACGSEAGGGRAFRLEAIPWSPSCLPGTVGQAGAVVSGDVSPGDGAPSAPLRLVELLASISLATDLGTGQPLGHGLRTCAMATAIAGAMGCASDQVRTVHQFALLRFVGCTADAAETAVLTGGDDLAFMRAMAPVWMGSSRGAASRFVRSVGAGQPALRRAGLVLRGLAAEVTAGSFRISSRSARWPGMGWMMRPSPVCAQMIVVLGCRASSAFIWSK